MARARAARTPNPDAMRFALDARVRERVDTARGEGEGEPLARALLAIEGVASVFAVSDFVTVLREPDADWDPIVCAVEEAVGGLGDDAFGAVGDEDAEDPVAQARALLRGASADAPPRVTRVELGRPPRPGEGAGE